MARNDFRLHTYSERSLYSNDCISDELNEAMKTLLNFGHEKYWDKITPHLWLLKHVKDLLKHVKDLLKHVKDLLVSEKWIPHGIISVTSGCGITIRYNQS